MKKYDVDISAKYQVTFPDEKKVIDYFILGDWKNTFYTFDDLEDICEHVTMGFHHEDSKYDHDKKTFYKFIEGFYPFYSDTNTGDWTSTDEESGAVIIVSEEDELDIEFCQEVDDV
jgi:hypothetical protein